MSDETKEIKLGASVTALGAPELYGTVTQIKDVPDAPDTGRSGRQDRGRRRLAHVAAGDHEAAPWVARR